MLRWGSSSPGATWCTQPAPSTQVSRLADHRQQRRLHSLLVLKGAFHGALIEGHGMSVGN